MSASETLVMPMMNLWSVGFLDRPNRKFPAAEWPCQEVSLLTSHKWWIGSCMK